ncbi:MAG TPA: phosphate ABC transporter permease PstA [Thermoanaerobaculia bacterium]|nr:phosphate ABC transporter permease PstA [Thermoanaerobaculia bacterium]
MTARSGPAGFAARRRIVSKVMTSACGAAVILALIPLAVIFFYILSRGVTALNWNFFTKLPRPTGEIGGGMANAIVGSLKLILIASAVSVPVGVLAGVYAAEYNGRPLASGVRFAADVLNGIPSIVIGIFAYGLVVIPMKRFSAIAGGLALAIMMIPIITRTTEELIRLVPQNLREGGLALGASRAKVTFSIIVPAALPGILTGILVAVARIAGETAPLLFTSLNNQFWSPRLDQPTASLTVQIYTYAISPYDDLHRQAWAGGLVLVGLILLFSILARAVTRRLERMNVG